MRLCEFIWNSLIQEVKYGKILLTLIVMSISLMTINIYGCEKHLAQELVNIAKERKLKIATAESCTGGMISSAITSISGSSSVLEYGFITYSNIAKEKILRVEHNTIEKYGAVSQETAREMANGALKTSEADIAVAVTGIAGPTGGSVEKPVGLVYIAIATEDKVQVIKNNFTGNREAIRLEATKKGLELLIKAIEYKK